MPDAVQRRVTQIDVRRGHVDLGAQHVLAVGEFTGAHATQQVEILRHRTIAVRAVLAGLGQRAAKRANLVRAQAVDIGDAVLDQLFGVRVELFEVVRRMCKTIAPVESEPAHIALDRPHVLFTLLARISVVEAQKRAPTGFLGDAEIEADRHDVADVQVAVRLGRKPRDNLRVLAGLEIVMNNLADEVPRCCIVHDL